jgi:hypothetical protein
MLFLLKGESMCGCSGALGWLTKAAKLFVYLFAINAGLAAAGQWDFFMMPSMMTSNAGTYIKYAVGLCGAYCLAMMLMHGMFCRCEMKSR